MLRSAEDSWMKLVPTDLPKSVRASSSFRIFRVSARATISCLCLLYYCVYYVFVTIHIDLCFVSCFAKRTTTLGRDLLAADVRALLVVLVLGLAVLGEEGCSLSVCCCALAVCSLFVVYVV